MAPEPVTIELMPEDIKAKPDSEKLNDLVDIAFSTHEQVSRQCRLLCGGDDPKKGLIHKVAMHDAILTWAFRGVSLVAIIGLVGKIWGKL
jgi:hypothetical protein